MSLSSYLRAYATELDVDIRTGHRVRRVQPREGGGFTILADADLELAADLVIAASGGFGSPHHPVLPGLESFMGQLLHAAEYRRPESFAGRRVLVVGGGNSAIQIAAELAHVARVSIATRSPLKFTAQRPLGRDLHWWLTRSGLDAAPSARWLRGHTTPVLDDGRYRAALGTGNPGARGMFAGLDDDLVVWPDGRRERVDAIILATGYRPHLDYLQGPGALDAEVRPLHRSGRSATVPGLGYVGLDAAPASA